jgi:alpha-tubulin suppressor-like RCC1 family protein
MKKTLSLVLVVFCLNTVVLGQCWKSISSGFYHTLALKPDGTLWSFGASGREGGTDKGISNPTQIGTSSDWVSISAGVFYSLALKNNGTLWAWGNNSFYQLGDGTQNTAEYPIQIGTETTWNFISAGGYHSMALKKDGTLWAWGNNSRNELGDGSFNSFRATPTKIGNPTDWLSISAGVNNTSALKKDGTRWAWGDNYSGEYGDGTRISSNIPKQIDAPTTWKMVVTSNVNSLGIKSDGTLWSWGENRFGQIGDGTFIERITPVQIGTDNDWQSISVSWRHCIAVKNNGTIWTWGYNSSGQLGDGTTLENSLPHLVGSDSDWKVISGGSAHSIALKVDGSMFGWGNYGGLGSGMAFFPKAIDCPASSLPIEIISFKAKNQNNQNHLTWQTATESNNEGFEIERSINGIDFEKIGFIKGVGSSNQIQSYRFIDTNPFNVTYYRLKQIDFFGKFDYSNTISIKIGKEKRIEFYPNPTNGIITIESEAILNADILIYNTIGKLVKISKAQNNTINISELPKGVYMVSMTNNENRFVKQIVKM